MLTKNLEKKQLILIFAIKLTKKQFKTRDKRNKKEYNLQTNIIHNAKNFKFQGIWSKP